MKPKILVTGAAGFIGSNFVEIAIKAGYSVIALDALTYAGHPENIESVSKHPEFKFVQGKIQDRNRVTALLKEHRPLWIANFAAESHVDRSIEGPAAFIDTNVNGVFNLLECAREFFSSLAIDEKAKFRFLQVSTDEVFGSLGTEGKFSEITPYQPNSPYSASKASADLLVRAWFHTYELPTLITNCSNNYGPRQFPEKLIPHMIFSALSGGDLPVYGSGENVRDWIHVNDHARGVLLALEKGTPGEAYCFGGNSERTNIDVVRRIAARLDQVHPGSKGSYSSQIRFVADRPGHDFRYAIDDSKAVRELGYSRKFGTFEEGLNETIDWYLQNVDWAKRVSGKASKMRFDWKKG